MCKFYIYNDVIRLKGEKTCSGIKIKITHVELQMNTMFGELFFNLLFAEFFT